MENLDPNFGNVIAAGFFGGRSESIKMARELFFKVHDIYLQKGMNVIREENIFNALFMYYPEYFMGLNMITSRCIEWDCAPIFISDKDICGFQNEVLLVKVVNNKFRIRGYDLGGWL